MNIQSTIQSLYAIMCAAQRVCENSGTDLSTLRNCLRSVSDKDVEQSLIDLNFLLQEMGNVNDNLKGMYMLHYTTGNDKEHVLLQMECVFGSQVVKFTTQMDQKATQSMIDALTWSLNMAKAGNRLGEEGRA